MGRVYRALVKAEKWAHPVGRPANYTDAVLPHRAADQDAIDETNNPATGVTHDGVSTAHQFGDGAATAHEFDFEAELSESEPFAISQALAISKPFYIAQPIVPATPVFVEPNSTANVMDLKVDPHLAAITSLDELASERYRTLAVRVLNFAARRKLKTLLVTSAQEGEGKTTVATNLAWVMAKSSERRVLLIDADLRNPSVSQMLGIKPSCDLLAVAEGRVQLIDSAIRIDPNGLYVLASQPAGANSDNHDGNSGHPMQADALASSRIESLIRELERYFDYIIIDAPPITEFADAQRLASIVDGTVMVARAGYTNHNAVTDALKLVPKDRRLGVVLNESQVDEEITYHNRKKQSGIRRFFAGKK